MKTFAGLYDRSLTMLVVVTGVVFASLGLARFGYSMVLPAMQTGLKSSNTAAGMLATVNLLGYLALSALGGALASRYGPRMVITFGLIAAGTGMLLTGTSGDLYTAAVWRSLTGIGSGASNVPAMGLLAAWFPARRRGLASGIAVTGSSFALIVLGPLVPYILSSQGVNGWRFSWYFFGAVTLVIALIGYLFLRDRPAITDDQLPGTDVQDTPDPSDSSRLRWSLVYRSAAVWHLGIVYIAFGFSYIVYMTFFVKLLIAEGGYSQVSAGNLFMVMGWFSLLCGLIWGWMSDHIGRKYTLILVYLIQAVAYILFALWDTPLGFTLSAILFGLTAWSIPAIMAATCGDVLGSRMAPAALGFITLFFGAGQAISPSIAGLIADTTGSFSSAFLLAGGVALLGALGSAFLRPHPPAG